MSYLGLKRLRREKAGKVGLGLFSRNFMKN